MRVWVRDEARFGLHTVPRRMWGLRGVRVLVAHQQKDEWDDTYGAVEVTRAGSVFCFQSTLHQECSQRFLEQISADDPAAIHGVIEDGAGFHLCEGDARVPANVRLIQLPADGPELNPVEKLWDPLKDAVCNQLRRTAVPSGPASRHCGRPCTAGWKPSGGTSPEPSL